MLANFSGIAYRSMGNLQGAMQFVSQGAEALCGYKDTALLASEPDWVDLIHPEDRPRVQALRQDAIEAGERFELQYRISNHAGQTLWVSEQGLAGSTDDGDAIVEGFISDITQRIAYEEQLRLQQEEMAHADRLSILGEMMAGVAHEINQPLTAVSTYAQSCLRFIDPENKRPDRLREALTKMISEIQRAGSVVQRIRDFASERVSENENIDCNELIVEAKQLADAQARMRGIRLQLQPAAEPVCVWGERVALLQVLLNLLRNAFEAIDEANSEAQVKLVVNRIDDEAVQIAVIDCGTGVAELELDDLFRPFATQKKERLGLGLTTSRAIATSHGGRLAYSNNQNQGATFFLMLPLSSARIPEVQPQSLEDRNGT
jgi:two-component system sensor kinase FixL